MRLAFLLPAIFFVTAACAQEGPDLPIVGRWDLTVHRQDGNAPSWLEVRGSGHDTLVGRFVGAFGSARPVGQVFYDRGSVRFSLPPQWEEGNGNIEFSGRLEDGRLSGKLAGPFFGNAPTEGLRAPALKRPSEEVRWGQAVALFNQVDLQGLHPRNASAKNGWIVRDRILINAEPGNDLVTDQTFTDFRVRAEFRLPKGSNSGLYLRGRYEVQIEDSFGLEPEEHMMGSIYGFIAPRNNPARPPSEWQTYEITLVGRRVTVALNGQVVIDRAEIPGITGGALDSREGEPGPLLIQGDHGTVEFRELTVALPQP
ncbi:MAG: DUF1080 domain-containing protein [Verrucomicrobiota bacterium]